MGWERSHLSRQHHRSETSPHTPTTPSPLPRRARAQALDENAPADVAAERDATLERISLLERGEAMRGGGGDAAKAAPPPAAAATPSQIALASQD